MAFVVMACLHEKWQFETGPAFSKGGKTGDLNYYLLFFFTTICIYHVIAVSTLLFETTHHMQVLRIHLPPCAVPHHLRMRAVIAGEKTLALACIDHQTSKWLTTYDKPFAPP